MPDDFATRVSGIGALAEPARRALYEFVVGSAEPVSRERAADGVGVPLHSAKFHLDRLVAEGLLEVEFRRLTGRTGPGAGRPAKLYRRSARQLSVSLPERRYDLAGEILATAVDRARSGQVSVDAAVRGAAEEAGRRAGCAAASGPAEASEPDAPAPEPEPEAPVREPAAEAPVPVPESEAGRTTRALAAHGYEPRSRGDQIVLANCPFDALVTEHTSLVCGLNECFVSGLLDGLGCTGLHAALDPEPGLCCVKIRPAPAGG
ncbi:MAG TPA: helix-turn-helix domain-containing protein [Nocardioidaceae bacterium]|nr:helix-turn-helix domain-containing protein [Nocardioidaceae bacterium]